MNATDARALLNDLTQWQKAPALESTEVDRLFARVPKVDDEEGREPGDVGYVDTYAERGVKRLAGEGWLLKAGKVVAQYEVSVGSGKTFKRDQQYKHCVNQAATFGVYPGTGGGGSGFGSLRLGTATATRAS